jgi:single-strand DNA-binding protein
MVNKMILVGRLTADPDVRATATGTHMASLRLATNTYAGKEDDGTRRVHTDYHSLVVFGKRAEYAAEHLRKGRLLYAEGRSQTRAWENAEGQRRYATEVVVDVLEPLEAHPSEGS